MPAEPVPPARTWLVAARPPLIDRDGTEALAPTSSPVALPFPAVADNDAAPTLPVMLTPCEKLTVPKFAPLATPPTVTGRVLAPPIWMPVLLTSL